MRMLMAVVVMCVGVVSLSAGGKQPNRPLANSGSNKLGVAYNQTVSSSNQKNGKGDNQKAVPVEGKDFDFELKLMTGFFSSRAVPVKMKWIPPGTFQMGSTAATDPDRNNGVTDRYNAETLHMVTLTRGFWLMETEVTQEMYYAVMGLGRGTARFPDLKNPMENVRWGDASDFCRAIGKNSMLTAFNDLSGFEFRLPTEAEWEYACRAGTTTAVYVNYGDRNKELDAIAWWDWNSGNATRNVRQKLPNAWGLYDMIGNVSEWCSDWYGNYPDTAVIDPTGKSAEVIVTVSAGDDGFRNERYGRVRRGGTWNSAASDARSAVRGRGDTAGFYDVTGFRPALSRVR